MLESYVQNKLNVFHKNFQYVLLNITFLKLAGSQISVSLAQFHQDNIIPGTFESLCSFALETNNFLISIFSCKKGNK